MKVASDFRSIAREALKGKWLYATIVAFIASVLGGSSLSSGGFSISSFFYGEEVYPLETLTMTDSEMMGILTIIIVVVLVMTLISMFIGGFISLGNAKFQLSVIDHKDSNIGDLFSQSSRFLDGFKMKFWVGLKVFLWSLLFVIPGIIKEYSYAMTPYIMYEHPELSAKDAMKASQEIMSGNKWRLFCLHFSFIGWELLLVVVGTIAVMWGALGAFGIIGVLLALGAIIVIPVCGVVLTAYMEASQAAFYREVSGTIVVEDQEVIIELEVNDNQEELL